MNISFALKGSELFILIYDLFTTFGLQLFPVYIIQEQTYHVNSIIIAQKYSPDADLETSMHD